MIKCKKFCQCHNVPPVKIKIKGKYLWNDEIGKS
jgi:hypothetical protein